MALNPFTNGHMKKPAALLLVCVLSLPVSKPAQAEVDDMFSVMFRMMLIMANVMSDAMLGNNNISGNNLGNNWGNSFGGLNSFNMGMSALPMMSGFTSPWNSIGSSPMGMSPWNSFGGAPMGMSPWNSFGSTPWGGSPWGGNGFNRYSGGYPGNANTPYGGRYGYPGARSPYSVASLLDGRWYGNTGEVLEINGKRFQLRTGGVSVGGTLAIQNNILTLYSPQTNTTTRYTYLLNQSVLLLGNGSGTVLTFRKVAPFGGTGFFR